ncbi:MAG: tetratricopeptide repeat protein, partial [Candidatus Hydrogenedens sp.]
ALKIDDKNPLAYNNLGYHAFVSGDIDKAIELYQKSLSIKPDLINALYNIADAFYVKGELKKVIPYFEKALEKQPHDHNLHNALGFYAFQVGMFDLAEEHLKEAINLEYKFPLAWRNLGNLYRKQKRYEEAEKAYKTALDIYPGDGEGWATYAEFKKEIGDYQQAIQLFQEAVQKLKVKDVPLETLTEVLIELGETYLKINDKNNAKKVFSEVISLNPQNDDIKQRIKRIGLSD